jgi:hypothetical protein
MRKIFAGGLAAIALLAATAASATTVIYKITKIDAPTHTVTLANGKAYVFDAALSLDAFKVGDQVKVVYTTDTGGKNMGSSIAKP